MRIFDVFIKAKPSPIIFAIALYLIGFTANAQRTTVSDFVLFGGTSGVDISSTATINGGSIGSFSLIKTSGSATISANIFSGGKVQLYNSNTVTGRITSANSTGIKGTILSVGSSSKITGNIDVNGNILISGGTVSGKVTHPAGTTYTGPLPSGGNITGTPSLPVLPPLPLPTVFPSAGSSDITSTRIITPGAYGNIILKGSQTLTLSGVGVYTFKSIKNTGSINNFIFDFKNTSTGNFKVYIYNDADLSKVGASLANGGSESRVYTEVHGTGASTVSRAAFDIAVGSSPTSLKWLGTVYATKGAINIGNGSGNGVNDISGALISATKVTLQSGLNIKYAPFVDQVIFPYYPPPATGKVYDILGSELNSLYANAASYTDTAQKLFILSHDSVYIECIAKQGKAAELLAFLQTPPQGLTDVIDNGPNSLIVSGKYPIAGLLKLDSLTDLIDYCRPLFPAVRNGRTGLTTTNGDIAVRSDFVRNGYNVDGDSIKVGVI